MQTLERSSITNQTPESLSHEARLRFLGLLVAALIVVSGSVSVYFTYMLLDVYGESVRFNLQWTERLDRYSELDDLVSKVNAPGNDVFVSGDPHAERARMLSALQRFDKSLSDAEKDLKINLPMVEAATFLKDLELVRSTMKEMTAAAEEIFSYLKQGENYNAGVLMAIMDRKNSGIRKTLARMRRKAREIMKMNLNEHAAKANFLAKFQFVIVALLLLMVGGVSAYGRVMSRRLEAARQERESYLARLEESEQRLRQVLDSLPVAVRVMQKGKVVFANPADARLFGFRTPGEEIGMDAYAQVAEEDVERLQGYAWKREAGLDAPRNYEVQARRHDGTVFSAEITAERIHYAGEPASLLALSDLTEHKRILIYEQILPVCSTCGKIRDDTGTEHGKGAWGRLDVYVARHSDAQLSHTFCPDCLEEYCKKHGLE